jgi:hypothetical protein
MREQMLLPVSMTERTSCCWIILHLCLVIVDKAFVWRVASVTRSTGAWYVLCSRSTRRVEEMSYLQVAESLTSRIRPRLSMRW